MTRLTVPGTLRRVTTADFQTWGFPVPSVIHRVGGGVALEWEQTLDETTRAAIVRKLQTPDDDSQTLREQAQVVVAALQTYLTNSVDPDPIALSNAQAATTAFLASPPVVAPTPDQATVQAILGQVVVLSQAYLADTSQTAQVRRLSRYVLALIRVVARRV